MAEPGAVEGSAPRKRKAALPQSDVPSMTAREALRVARAINDELARVPSPPVQVAAAMRIQPTTGNFRTLTAASVAYGFTEGGAWAERIGLTPLGRMAVAPVEEGQEDEALREAVLRPRVVREFLTRYNGAKWPREDIGCNVLADLGVPVEQAKRALDIIHRNADDTGLLTTISGSEFVNLHAAVHRVIDGGDVSGADAAAPAQRGPVADAEGVSGVALGAAEPSAWPMPGQRDEPGAAGAGQVGARPVAGAEPLSRRVFLSLRAGDPAADEIAGVLEFGDLEPVQPEQASAFGAVVEQMRSCTFGVVLVTGEPPSKAVSPTRLLEIGAAMALFGDRLVLLMEQGVEVPAEVTGLPYVALSGRDLDRNATLGLMRALADVKRRGV